jgi:SAM-dependent methyltransferase
MSDAAFREAQLALFESSVLKQAKWNALRDAVGETHGVHALDLGSDNGVISWMFRRQGGTWTSADLTDETVRAIRRMVGDHVVRLTDARLPFEDGAFDRIVVVDLLEHLEDDRRLLLEISRCLRPGGRAVLNLPHLKPRALLPRVRHAIGLTDQWHGHVHAGYTAPSLATMLPSELRLTRARTYSGTFSHVLDTALNAVFLRKSRGRARSTAKGTVVTGDAVAAKDARALRRLVPAMRAFTALDRLLPWSGYMLLVELVREPSSTSR